MEKASFRKLTPEQIAALRANGCRASNWGSIEVSERFDPDRVHGTHFEGTIRIGSLDAAAADGTAGPARPAGIENARLRNVVVGDNCWIASVNGWISDIDVGNGAVIENVGCIEAAGESAYGNGYAAPVLVEAGGRACKLTTELSAQLAYVSVMYRHDSSLTQELDAMADAHVRRVRGTPMTIGDGARIVNTQRITNVRIGPHAFIDGTLSLREGTIESSFGAPALVGPGVIARDFIFMKGSQVTDGAMISGSLVGEGVRIGKQFSCDNSLFFANSEGFYSEVSSVFAGPYTVTHHRSTLLIAGFFSFFNAGSGTNQSNHMYKLGPVHQGICERGCKTGSSSYLLWPCRIGAFTTVIGKHLANFDTSDLPFSTITEEGGKSRLAPGMNLFTVGLLRDGVKWPARDNRAPDARRDLISFEVFSPYTARKMARGIEHLERLAATTDRGQQFVNYQGIQMRRLLLRNGVRCYRSALDKYVGDLFVRRARQYPGRSVDELVAGGPDGTGEWVDVCGLLCPQARIDALCKRIAAGELRTYAQAHESLARIHECYREDEWSWLCANYPSITGTPLRGNVVPLLDAWKKASTSLLTMALLDAEKEFSEISQTGFGIDGHKDGDFAAVRGGFHDGEFVKSLEQEIRDVGAAYDEMARRFG